MRKDKKKEKVLSYLLLGLMLALSWVKEMRPDCLSWEAKD